MIISPLSFCIVAFCLISNVVAPKPHHIRKVELAAKDGHLTAESARREAAAHSRTAQEQAIVLHDHVNDGRHEDIVEKIDQIVNRHEINNSVQNARANHHSRQSNIHRDNIDQNSYGDKTQRKSAMEAAERSLEAAKQGKKEAEKSYTHTDATIGFLQLGQSHFHAMREVGRMDPNYESHHRALRNCVDNAAEAKPSQRKLKNARENFDGLTNIGLLGWQSTWST